PRGTKQQSQPLSAQEQASRQVQIDRFVSDYFEKFDANRDQQVQRDETPLSLGRYGFNSLDRDGDGRVTKPELEDAARRKMKF
ncbi:MAG: alkyl hydroperoxide reductase, partial [Planctomycetaceae bacterium]